MSVVVVGNRAMLAVRSVGSLGSIISRSEELSERQALIMAREILELAEEQFQKKRDEEGGATPTHLRITPPSRMYCLSHFSYILIINRLRATF
jgi:hypothetical protein